jgi:AraC-like DNA-binding protein
MAFSTAGLPVDEQFGAWRDACSPVVELSEPAGRQPGYLAKYEMWKLGPFVLSTVTAPGVTCRRSKAQIRRDSLDHWVVSVSRRYAHGPRTRAGAARGRGGVPYILSLDEAFDSRCTNIDWLCLFVPREVFPELGSTIDRCRHLLLDSAMGRLLGSYLISLERQVSIMTDAELPRVVAATRDMIAACVAPSVHNGLVNESRLELARLERVRQVIRQNLRSPTLAPKRLSKLVGMSRSQLYRLLEPVGGVARYIQAERLREAHRALSDPTNDRDIYQIGEDLGLFNASSFSRVFRREFGYSPSDLRMAALSGQHIAPVSKSAVSVAKADVVSWLRQL